MKVHTKMYHGYAKIVMLMTKNVIGMPKKSRWRQISFVDCIMR